MEHFQKDKYNLGLMQQLVMEDNPEWELDDNLDKEEKAIWLKTIRAKRAELKRKDKK